MPPSCLLLNPGEVPALYPHCLAGLGMPCDQGRESGCLVHPHSQRPGEWVFGAGKQGLTLFPGCLAVSQGAGCTGAHRELCEGWGLAGSGLNLLHGMHVPLS